MTTTDWLDSIGVDAGARQDLVGGLGLTPGANIGKGSEEAFARAREKMPDWFGTLPKADCLVEETSSGAQAFYFPAADDGSRPGMFFMNTADPSSGGIHQVESTAFHEGIPGHHPQGSIAQGLGDSVPDFRPPLPNAPHR